MRETPVGTYTYEWPITAAAIGPAATAAALAELYDAVDTLGYRTAGPVTYQLVASVPVTLAGDGPDDPLPWESRDGYAGEMLDVLAA
jgi:hypothetical protein